MTRFLFVFILFKTLEVEAFELSQEIVLHSNPQNKEGAESKRQSSFSYSGLRVDLTGAVKIQADKPNDVTTTPPLSRHYRFEFLEKFCKLYQRPIESIEPEDYFKTVSACVAAQKNLKAKLKSLESGHVTLNETVFAIILKEYGNVRNLNFYQDCKIFDLSDIQHRMSSLSTILDRKK